MDNQTTVACRRSLLRATTLAAVTVLGAVMAFAPSQADADFAARASA
jgi:hypothetical protein